MDDKEILQRIGALVDEERTLLDQEGRDGADTEKRGRIREIEVTLDQCWDLLRQRRALREFGADPDSAGVRARETVERYQQ
jgi:hypothetical protein